MPAVVCLTSSLLVDYELASVADVAMDKSEVLARLEQDNPLFHYMDEAAVDRAAPGGYTLGVGEVSFGVGPKVGSVQNFSTCSGIRSACWRSR